mmetsp:Transcript_58569/g.188232  ORF Transcript_58569/g.188232 Transcript_58569/m.188232 type:complete len:538 (-) Transcript_58569:129-1742(-)
MPKRSSQKRWRSSSSSDSEVARKRQKKRKDKEKNKEKDSERARDTGREKDRQRDNEKSIKEQDKAKDKDTDKGWDRGRRRRRSSERSTSSSSPQSSSRCSQRSSGERNKATLGTPKAPEAEALGSPEHAATGAAGGRRPGLGDLAELQKQLDEERGRLQLFVLKAKQEHEEKRETSERRERREREYYKPSWGEPCGPENRFLLEGELGKGAFSTVYRCRDMAANGKEYAIKFIRLNAMLRKATEKEVRLMRRLRSRASEEDPDGARFFLGLAGPETFEHRGHLAVVFQLQKCDLRSGLQKYGQGRGLPLPTVQCYAGNIFLALRALRKVNVIHSDIKPDNLLITLDKMSVKLSDFGSSMDVAERVRTDYVQPRFYRSPEVILGQCYDTQIDMWSTGVTLFELATGRILLQGKTNNDMMHAMLKVCGAFPRRFATSGDFAPKHFNVEGDFRCHDPGSGAVEVVMPMASFQKPSQPPQLFLHLLEDHIKDPPPGSDEGRHQVRMRRLADLVARCLVPVPANRMTPEAALGHSFLQSCSK